MIVAPVWVDVLHVVSMVDKSTTVCIDRLAPVQESKPSYRELEAVLKGIQGSSSSQTWAQRLSSEFAFNKESLNRKQ